ncbi:MAG: phasin family protein [Deltaproteobacteria bacterium]|nr:MAG: phasin family protein [Deltaproteobacteria bacterium]
MARKKNIRKILKQSIDSLSTEISTLAETRASKSVERARASAEKMLRKNLKAALKAIGIPTKDDLKKLSRKITTIDKKMRKLTKQSSGRKVKTSTKAKRVCTIRGCNAPYRSKGYCERHYQQWRRGRLK